MDAQERTHLEKLLEIHYTHLRELEIKAAKYTDLDLPTHVTLQLAEERKAIAALEGRLQATLPHHNLPPRDYERFVGRQKELADIRRLLQPYPKSRHHLVTIDGIGGIGKSALALETAYAYRDGYAALPPAERFDAIVWVSAKRTLLTADGILERRQAFSTLDDLYAAIAQTLDYPAIIRARTEEQRAIVEQALGEQRTLLILDNLETVDDEELLVFLRELPDPTKAIVTTRHRIDVAYPVRLSGMSHADALALIAQEAVRKDVQLEDAVREALWQRTGGVPLAIVWSIGLMGLGGSVESVLRRLGSGQSDIARFCFEESVAQIRGHDAHKLLLALSLFAVDASREALGAVAGLGKDEFGRDTGLEALVRLSLVNKDGDRYSLLPLTRGFVQAEAAQQRAWMESATGRWIQYYDRFVEEFSGWSDDWRGHDRVERELTNIFDVFHHLSAELRYTRINEREQELAAESIPQAKLFLRLFDRVGRTSRIRGYWNLIDSEIGTALRISRAIDGATTGWLCYLSAQICYFRGDLEMAKRWAHELLASGQQRANNAMLLRAHLWLGLIAIAEGRLDEAQTLLEAAWGVAELSEKTGGRSNILTGKGQLAARRGDVALAANYYQQAIDLERQRNDLPKLALYSLYMGQLFLGTGDVSAARPYFDQSLQLAEECGWATGLGGAAYGMAAVDVAQGQTASAEKRAQQALDVFRRLGMRREQAEAEALLARLEESEIER